MKNKIIPCLALVLSGVLPDGPVATLYADEATTNAPVHISIKPVEVRDNDSRALGFNWIPAVQQQPSHVPFNDYLFTIGDKLGCYFTLEYQSYSIVGKSSGVFAIVTNDMSITSIPMLVSKLRRDMKGFAVEQDSKNSKIIHIVEQVLEQQKDYVLNKRTSVQYSGNLVNCVVKDAEGRNLVHGEGIVNAVAEKVGGIRNGTEEAGSLGAFDDCLTMVSVNATNETVRSILTDCIRVADYKIILWRAVHTTEKEKPMTLVQFYGAKKP